MARAGVFPNIDERKLKFQYSYNPLAHYGGRGFSLSITCHRKHSLLFKKIHIQLMPRGRSSRFSEKEDRQAKHIAESERKRGKSAKTAKRIGYAMVNKQKKGEKGE
jgi:hypothetical protein